MLRSTMPTRSLATGCRRSLPNGLPPVVTRVRDVRTGELAIYVGTEEITHIDPTLARALVRAASH
jgi:hypothetical protein